MLKSFNVSQTRLRISLEVQTFQTSIYQICSKAMAKAIGKRYYENRHGFCSIRIHMSKNIVETKHWDMTSQQSVNYFLVSRKYILTFTQFYPLESLQQGWRDGSVVKS